MTARAAHQRPGSGADQDAAPGAHPDAGSAGHPDAPADADRETARGHRDAAPARRDAETTKAVILKAARHLLARRSQADVTLKEVAERAGVSAPLVLKYFGNKDALFARVMSFEADADALLDAPLPELGAHMVRHVLDSQRERGADPLLRIVFAPLHGDQGDVLRANFRAQVTRRLATRLTGPDAGLRAELAVAVLLGLGVMYGIARGPHLRDADPADIAARYGSAVQAQLTPPA